MIKLARSAGKVKNPQGFIVNKEYDAISDQYQETGEDALDYLPGPGVAFFETILVTAGVNKDGRPLGTKRGSLRFAMDTIRRRKGRFLIFQASEDVKDVTGEQREEFRNTKKGDIVSIARKAKIESDEEEPTLLQNYYDDASNERTRVQQDNATSEVVFGLLQDSILEYSGPKFPDLESFRLHYLGSHRKEWEQLSNLYYNFVLQQAFDESGNQVSPEDGSVIFDHTLPEGTTVHIFPQLLRKIDLIEALKRQALIINNPYLNRKLAIWGLARLHPVNRQPEPLFRDE